MATLTPTEIVPAIKMCNYITVPLNQSWGPRTIPDFELILIIRGRYAYDYDDRRFTVQTGDVLCIPPQEEHTLIRIDRESESQISCIHLELSDCGTWASGSYELDPFPERVVCCSDFERVRSLFEYSAELFSGYGKYRTARLQTAVRQIVLRLAEYWEVHEHPNLSQRIQEMLSFLRERVPQALSRQDLAKAFGLSPEYINALFKKELGVSPTQYVNRERIMRAYRLMHEEGYTVREAAEAMAFCDQFYFSKLFKREFGVPPSNVTWRRSR